jgi:hypothetical protein
LFSFPFHCFPLLILKRLRFSIFFDVLGTIKRLFWGFFSGIDFIDALQFFLFVLPEQDLIGRILEMFLRLP